MKEFENNLVDLMTKEVENILQWIEVSKTKNSVDDLTFDSIMKIY